MGVQFENRWLEDAAKKALNWPAEEDLTQEALEKIKYVKIGRSNRFNNGYEVELSTEVPPEPFADTDGGDEWVYCLRGKNIEAFLNQERRNNLLNPSMFGFDDEEYNEAHSDAAQAAWENYKPHIVSGFDFLEVIALSQAEGMDATDRRAERLFYELYRDILHFTGVQVLRITELVMPDYRVFQEMKQLRVLELVEAHFTSDEGYECLKGLQQLACWLD
ncbi:MAG: hypothetical protein K6F26_00805 [Lachnospiraceae bacterium]|nr:hypothetical protein [Lachnospiraceae bacterium]